MTQKIIFLSSVSDLNIIPEDLLQENDTKVFSFNLNVHLELETKKVNHEIADDLLTEEDRLKIFNQMLKFRKWYSTVTSKDLEFENVNILKLFDTHEFSSYLMPNLINFILIKKIIEKKNQKKLFLPVFLKNLLIFLVKILLYKLNILLINWTKNYFGIKLQLNMM